jgi:hypothetical protein
MASAWWTDGGAVVARAPRWLADAGGGEIREVERREKKKKKNPPKSKSAKMTRNSSKHPK